MKIKDITKFHRNKPGSVDEEAPAGDNSSDLSDLPSEFEEDEDLSRPGQKRNYQQASGGNAFGGNSMGGTADKRRR